MERNTVYNMLAADGVLPDRLIRKRSKEMPTHTTQYAMEQVVGVKHAPEFRGMVTAIFIRGGNVTYEVGYTQGEPTTRVFEESELTPINEHDIGFRKRK